MAFSVNTNVNAMVAIQTLDMTQQSLSITQSRINSGLKVGNASDNASTFTIAQGMRGDIHGMKEVTNALSLGETTANVALQAAQTISNTLNTLMGKVVAGQQSNVDLNAIQKDIQGYLDQIDSISASAQFNGVNLINNTQNLTVLSSLNRTSSTSLSAAFITLNSENLTTAGLGLSGLQVQGTRYDVVFSASMNFTDGTGMLLVNPQGQTYNFEFDNNGSVWTSTNTVVAYTTTQTPLQRLGAFASVLESKGFSVTLNQNGSLTIPVAVSSSGYVTNMLDVQSVNTINSTASNAISLIQTAINKVKTALSNLGAASNRLQTQADFVQQLTNNLTAGVGGLVDANMAEESAHLQALQVKQQLGMQALSIANQQPSSVLSLFR